MGFYKKSLIGGFWSVNKTIAKFFKCIHTALILDELIFHEYKHSDNLGWFYYNAELLEENCMIGEKMRKKCINNLIKANILSVEKRGLPARFYYKINHDNVDIIFSDGTSPLPESGTGDMPEEGTIYIKEKEINNKVVVEEECPTTTTNFLNDDFKSFEKSVLDCPYYKRLKTPRTIKKVYSHFGSFKVFNSNYESLMNLYVKKKPYYERWQETDEKCIAWYDDCHSFIENSILKEIEKK